MATCKEAVFQIYQNLKQGIDLAKRSNAPVSLDQYRTFNQLEAFLNDSQGLYFSHGVLTAEGLRILDKINRYYRA